MHEWEPTNCGYFPTRLPNKISLAAGLSGSNGSDDERFIVLMLVFPIGLSSFLRRDEIFSLHLDNSHTISIQTHQSTQDHITNIRNAKFRYTQGMYKLDSTIVSCSLTLDIINYLTIECSLRILHFLSKNAMSMVNG